MHSPIVMSAINGDGTIIATCDATVVRVFRILPSGWEQIGSDIEASASNICMDHSGYCVAYVTLDSVVHVQRFLDNNTWESDMVAQPTPSGVDHIDMSGDGNNLLIAFADKCHQLMTYDGKEWYNMLDLVHTSSDMEHISMCINDTGSVVARIIKHGDDDRELVIDHVLQHKSQIIKEENYVDVHISSDGKTILVLIEHVDEFIIRSLTYTTDWDILGNVLCTFPKLPKYMSVSGDGSRIAILTENHKLLMYSDGVCDELTLPQQQDDMSTVNLNSDGNRFILGPTTPSQEPHMPMHNTAVYALSTRSKTWVLVQYQTMEFLFLQLEHDLSQKVDRQIHKLNEARLAMSEVRYHHHHTKDDDMYNSNPMDSVLIGIIITIILVILLYIVFMHT
jgi:hypothetical protein